LTVGAIAVLGASCGTSGSNADRLARCEAYCSALRTAPGGCGGNADQCAADCPVWIQDAVDQACESTLDDLLSCTDGSPNVCSSIRQECEAVWKAWYSCGEGCNLPGKVVASPGCTAAMPCKSGASISIAGDIPLKCEVKVTLTCPGGTATGVIPKGTAMGSIIPSCTGQGTCGLEVDTPVNALMGSSDIVCGP